MSFLVTFFEGRFSLQNQAFQRRVDRKKNSSSNFFMPCDIFSCEPQKNGVLLLRHLKTVLSAPHLRPSPHRDPQIGKSKTNAGVLLKKNNSNSYQSQKHMKPKIIQSILAAALLAPGALFAQTTATTTPVGYVSLGNNGTVPANADVVVTIPLFRPAIFSGTVASVSGSTITISGTPGLGSLTSVPHTVVIGSGSKIGLNAVVTSSTSNSVTVSVSTGDSLSGVTAGDTISIRPAWTVRSFLGASFPAGTQLLTLPDSGSFNPSAVGIYEWDGTGWVDTVVSGDYADNDVLYPNETYIVRNQSATPLTSFVVSGDVPVVPNRVVIAASGASGSDNAVCYFSPVTEKISTSGLTAIANPGDQVLGFNNTTSGFNKAATTILEYDGTGWVDTVVSGDYEPNFPIGGGQGFIFRRASTSTSSIWTDVPSYLPLP